VTLLITRAELGGRPGIDVRVEHGLVTEIGAGLARRPGDELLDAAGGALLPGLHDHHVHLWALAARAASIAVGPPDVHDERAFAAALRAAPGDGWVRGVGYHESVAGDLDRDRLDALAGGRPVRVQHRGGALLVLSSEAMRRTGADSSDEPGIEREGTGRATGRLWRMDRWLRERVPPTVTDLGAVSLAGAAAGVTGYTDATPDRDEDDVEALCAAQEKGSLRQRVHLMGPVGLRVDAGPLLSLGAVKVLLDDVDLPEPPELVARVRAAHASGRPVAVHCVTAVQLVLTLHAVAEAGAVAGDRIEHASVVANELVPEIARLGMTVVTQPGFVAERGDRYLAEVDPDEIGSLYRCGSLLAAGVATAAGTDAPFGHPDPWAAIRAAIDRRTAGGAVLGTSERVDPVTALGLFLGSTAEPGARRVVAAGVAADLCLLDAPLAEVLEAPSADRVAATLVDGRVVHRSSV
jgi:predicted amidohydrolase YtcJ